MLKEASLARRMYVPTIGLFVVSMAVLLGIQHTLYVRGFEDTLGRIEGSSLDVQRESSKGMAQGIWAATDRWLQTGEHTQFVDFAHRQREQSSIGVIAFVGLSGTAELASPVQHVGTPLAEGVWDQAAETSDLILREDAKAINLYQPLHVTPDMRRLRPDMEVGTLYGLLHLEFPKDELNKMLADARSVFEGRVRQSLTLTCATGVAALVVMAVSLFPLVVLPLVRSLQGVIGNLGEGSKELVEISRQIGGASQRLATSASEQASSLEETSSAMEQMSAMTRTNAANAREADTLSAQAQENAAAGDQTMVRLTQAMTSINESSAQIAKIIKVIEEIAFQTNLLALNAAVEAARAGEHGKGFAVVADEVRNLASRAAEAARNTRTLVEDSVGRARDGVEAVREAGVAFGAIVASTQRVSELVGEIARASEQQAQGVDQVNSAVSQMSQMTQESASEASHSSSVAEQLGLQAESVKDMVGALVGIVKGAGAAREEQEL